MDLWFANGTKLKTGDTQTACVSCHAGLAYALSRPVLRRVMQVDAPSTQEARSDRRHHAPRRDLQHTPGAAMTSTSAGRIESRGTEAVLNAVILTSADAARNLREPSAAHEEGAGAVCGRHSEPMVRWDWLEFGLEPWETTEPRTTGPRCRRSLAGTRAGPARRGRNRRHRASSQRISPANYHAQHLYNRTWALLASTG
jgi:hypothetical protein